MFTVYTAYYYEKGRSIYSIGDSYWYFLFAFITGVVRFSPATFWGRAITLLSSVVRICLYGTILAKISSVFINFQNQRDKGLTKLKNLTKHFILCGWKPDFEDILEGILFANPEIPPEKIVANLKKVKTLKSNIPVFNPPSDYVIPESSKAIFIHGNYTKETR